MRSPVSVLNRFPPAESLRPMAAILVIAAVLILVFPADGVVQGATPAEATPTLSLFPETAVLNQQISLLGTGFTPSTGSANQDRHQITGIGASQIFVAGIALRPPHVSYPITIDTGGGWTTSLIIPAIPEISPSSSVTITAVDDQGLTKSALLSIKPLSIRVAPASSSRNTEIRVTGEGFPASTLSPDERVSITYAGQEVGQAVPNHNGEFEFTMMVPETAFIESNNEVQATRAGFIFQYAKAVHTVPAARITLSPTSGAPGDAVTVSGENFPAFSIVSGAKVREIPSLISGAQNTDHDGRFTGSVVIPLFAPGVQTISATVGDMTATSPFTVLDGPAVQPVLPLKSTTEVVQAMESLKESGNLIRVWHFDNHTKLWSFYDPREAFANANTITNMVSDQVYWLRVNDPQSTVLNGRQATLSTGWNLMTW